MSQCDAILADFQRGNALTHRDAEDRHNCTRLAARVLNLKKRGHDIRKKMIQVPSGKWVALYWLELPKGQLSLFQQKGPVVEVHRGLSCALGNATVSPTRQIVA
jgi:hypothetical protein